ncbi:hypothetical protein AB0D46_21110 [Streptomyces sp. NPDC048383]|uniref:hypothetical protein n=1 Tax=Streptomyces sp. NPDC048383 TaxID=3155386 RepID=UPI00341FEBE8
MTHDETVRPATFLGRELPAAAAISAGQPLLLLAAAFVLTGLAGPYDHDRGEGAFGAVLLTGFLLLSPLLLPVLGLLHAALFALPVTGSAHALGRRGRVPAGVWAVLLTAALAALYAAAGRWRFDLPYGPTWAWVAGTGLLPVAAARYARARDVRPWGMIRRAAGVTGAGLLLLGGGHAAGLAGLLPEYRPPRLAASEYAGTWTGDGGARLVLHRDGTMSAEALPVVARDGGIDRCTGDGTWSFDPEAVPANRDGVWLDIRSCTGSVPAWRISGTTERPELFTWLYGPDADVLKVLRSDADADGARAFG